MNDIFNTFTFKSYCTIKIRFDNRLLLFYTSFIYTITLPLMVSFATNNMYTTIYLEIKLFYLGYQTTSISFFVYFTKKLFMYKLHFDRKGVVPFVWFFTGLLVKNLPRTSRDMCKLAQQFSNFALSNTFKDSSMNIKKLFVHRYIGK